MAIDGLCDASSGIESGKDWNFDVSGNQRKAENSVRKASADGEGIIGTDLAIDREIAANADRELVALR